MKPLRHEWVILLDSCVPVKGMMSERNVFLALINYSCSSYSTRASYSGQVDGFRNPMKNELKTTACLEIISNTDANFLNLHIHKERKTTLLIANDSLFTTDIESHNSY